MDFLLFLLVNATLFIRPGELAEGVANWPIYNVLILATLAVASLKVVPILSLKSLTAEPITTCVVGILAAVFLSHACRLDFWHAREGTIEFAKVVIYYLLIVAVVDSPARFRGFLAALVAFGMVLTSLALAHYHGWIEIPSLAAFADREIDAATGEEFMMMRLCSTGIYNDPNDLSMILLVCAGSCAYLAAPRAGGLPKLQWIPPAGLFLYALTLTHSRGGFLALLAGTITLFYARFGGKKAALLACLALPVLFVLFAGRQTNISTSEDTGQDRIQLWVASFQMLRESPLFGIGWNQYHEKSGAGLVAHNSFIHGYGELGFFGGTLFLGAFVYAAYTLHAIRRDDRRIGDELRRLRPYLLAMVVAYSVSMATLSRNYVVPTYMILGLVTAFLRLASRDDPALASPGGAIAPVDGRLMVRAGYLGIAFLIMANIFVKVFVRWG